MLLTLMKRRFKTGVSGFSFNLRFSSRNRAIKLRETKHIRGIEIKLNSITGNIKKCQLAEDTTLFLKTIQEITIAMNII